MGCCFSRKDSKLVKLCKERKELIKDARDLQCSLAFAHMAYFQSLQEAENEFSNFMNEAIVIYHGSPSDTISDHLKEQFPPSENSSLGNSDEAKDEEVAEDDFCVKGGSNLSEFQSENNRGKVYYSKEAIIDSKTCFNGIPHNVLQQSQVAATKNTEHLLVRSFKGVTDQPWYGKIVESSKPRSSRFPQSESAGLRPSGNLVFPPYRKESFISESQDSVSNTATFAYKRSSMSCNDMKSATPSDNFTDNLHNRLTSNANTALFNGQNAFPHMNLRFYQNENEATENYLMAFPPHYPWGYQMQSRQHNEISIWDYLNPFTLVENPYNTGFRDIDLQGVRESEGIPDLEDISDDKISSEEDLELNENSEECHFEAMHEPNENNVELDQRISIGKEKNEEFLDKNNLDSRPNYPMSEELKTDKRQQSSVQKEVEEIHESIKESVQIDENAAEASSEALVSSSTNLQEVYNKIKKEFDNINIHGNYVSDMLEAGKLHHQPGSTLFNGFPRRKSRIGSGMALSCTCGMSRRPAYRIPNRKNAGSEDLKDTNINACNLLLTLEKLYIWESKLHEGVKNEEKLRITFDKEWRKLKKLDDQGAESDKIEAHQLSLRKLTSRINLFISKVDGIAKQIHKLRDEELQPQLCELIRRLQQMFKVSFECHKKQAQVIMEAKVMVEFSCMTNNSSMRAVRKLEAEILKLGTTFSDWIRTHKAFVEHLKNWLTKCHLEESEETTYENSSSPCTSLGAPTVVAICHDWFNAIEKASDIEVLGAINSFAVLLHRLQKQLLKEKQQRLKVQHYSRRHEKKLMNFYRESSDRGVDCGHRESLLNGVQAIDSIEIEDPTLQTMHVNLILTRNRLNEAKAEHEEVIKQVNDMVTLIGQSGFLPILKALESFHLEMLNAFQQIYKHNFEIKNGFKAIGKLLTWKQSASPRANGGGGRDWIDGYVERFTVFGEMVKKSARD